METIVNAMKETAIEMMTSGVSGMQVAKAIAEKFGNEVARLIMCDIALDRGMKTEVENYLNSFS